MVGLANVDERHEHFVCARPLIFFPAWCRTRPHPRQGQRSAALDRRQAASPRRVAFAGTNPIIAERTSLARKSQTE
jgi:hypothetical protein